MLFSNDYNPCRYWSLLFDGANANNLPSESVLMLHDKVFYIAKYYSPKFLSVLHRNGFVIMCMKYRDI